MEKRRSKGSPGSSPMERKIIVKPIIMFLGNINPTTAMSSVVNAFGGDMAGLTVPASPEKTPKPNESRQPVFSHIFPSSDDSSDDSRHSMDSIIIERLKTEREDLERKISLIKERKRRKEARKLSETLHEPTEDNNFDQLDSHGTPGPASERQRCQSPSYEFIGRRNLNSRREETYNFRPRKSTCKSQRKNNELPVHCVSSNRNDCCPSPSSSEDQLRIDEWLEKTLENCEKTQNIDYPGSSSVAVKTPLKRGRGRPKKLGGTVKTPLSGPKRGVGRPKKCAYETPRIVGKELSDTVISAMEQVVQSTVQPVDLSNDHHNYNAMLHEENNVSSSSIQRVNEDESCNVNCESALVSGTALNAALDLSCSFANSVGGSREEFSVKNTRNGSQHLQESEIVATSAKEHAAEAPRCTDNDKYRQVQEMLEAERGLCDVFSEDMFVENGGVECLQQDRPSSIVEAYLTRNEENCAEHFGVIVENVSEVAREVGSCSAANVDNECSVSHNDGGKDMIITERSNGIERSEQTIVEASTHENNVKDCCFSSQIDQQAEKPNEVNIYEETLKERFLRLSKKVNSSSSLTSYSSKRMKETNSMSEADYSPAANGTRLPQENSPCRKESSSSVEAVDQTSLVALQENDEPKVCSVDRSAHLKAPSSKNLKQTRLTSFGALISSKKKKGDSETVPLDAEDIGQRGEDLNNEKTNGENCSNDTDVHDSSVLGERVTMESDWANQEKCSSPQRAVSPKASERPPKESFPGSAPQSLASELILDTPQKEQMKHGTGAFNRSNILSKKLKVTECHGARSEPEILTQDIVCAVVEEHEKSIRAENSLKLQQDGSDSSDGENHVEKIISLKKKASSLQLEDSWAYESSSNDSGAEEIPSSYVAENTSNKKSEAKQMTSADESSESEDDSSEEVVKPQDFPSKLARSVSNGNNKGLTEILGVSDCSEESETEEVRAEHQENSFADNEEGTDVQVRVELQKSDLSDSEEKRPDVQVRAEQSQNGFSDSEDERAEVTAEQEQNSFADNEEGTDVQVRAEQSQNGFSDSEDERTEVLVTAEQEQSDSSDSDEERTDVLVSSEAQQDGLTASQIDRADLQEGAEEQPNDSSSEESLSVGRRLEGEPQKDDSEKTYTNRSPVRKISTELTKPALLTDTAAEEILAYASSSDESSADESVQSDRNVSEKTVDAGRTQKNVLDATESLERAILDLPEEEYDNKVTSSSDESSDSDGSVYKNTLTTTPNNFSEDSCSDSRLNQSPSKKASGGAVAENQVNPLGVQERDDINSSSSESDGLDTVTTVTGSTNSKQFNLKITSPRRSQLGQSSSDESSLDVNEANGRKRRKELKRKKKTSGSSSSSSSSDEESTKNRRTLLTAPLRSAPLETDSEDSSSDEEDIERSPLRTTPFMFDDTSRDSTATFPSRAQGSIGDLDEKPVDLPAMIEIDKISLHSSDISDEELQVKEEEKPMIDLVVSQDLDCSALRFSQSQTIEGLTQQALIKRERRDSEKLEKQLFEVVDSDSGINDGSSSTSVKETSQGVCPNTRWVDDEELAGTVDKDARVLSFFNSLSHKRKGKKPCGHEVSPQGNAVEEVTNEPNKCKNVLRDAEGRRKEKKRKESSEAVEIAEGSRECEAPLSEVFECVPWKEKTKRKKTTLEAPEVVEMHDTEVISKEEKKKRKKLMAFGGENVVDTRTEDVPSVSEAVEMHSSEVISKKNKKKGKKSSIIGEAVAETRTEDVRTFPEVDEIHDTEVMSKKEKKKRKKSSVIGEALAETRTEDVCTIREVDEIHGTEVISKKDKKKRKKSSIVGEAVAETRTEDVCTIREVDEIHGTEVISKKDKKKRKKSSIIGETVTETGTEDVVPSIPEEVEMHAMEVNCDKEKKKRKNSEMITECDRGTPQGERDTPPIKKRKSQKRTAADSLIQSDVDVPKFPDHFLKDLSQVKVSSKVIQGPEASSQQTKDKKMKKKNMKIATEETEEFIPLTNTTTKFSAVVLDRIDARASKMTKANFKNDKLFGGSVNRAPSNSVKVRALKLKAMKER